MEHSTHTGQETPARQETDNPAADDTLRKLSRGRFEEAARQIRPAILDTRLIYSEYYSEHMQNQVYFKPENLQYTGSFKIRGAYYRLCSLLESEKARGIVTASVGNYGLAIAYAARHTGVPVTVVMPKRASLIQVKRIRGYGAEVLFHGQSPEEALAYARDLAGELGRIWAEPSGGLAEAVGAGTIALEILRELPDADYILAPIGSGGLCAGIAAAAKQINPQVQVIGVEPAGANCVEQSLRQGRAVTLAQVNTIADAAAVRTPAQDLLPCIQRFVDGILLVDDTELVAAFSDVMENHKMAVENAGLLTVAALRHLKRVKGKKIVSVLSGGNMDMVTMASVVQGGLILRDRIFTVSVLLADQPGALANVAHVIGEEQGSIIKLDHNQFINMNRSESVELRITLEAFGTDHKNQIVQALKKQGYQPRIVSTTGTYEM